MTQLSIDFRTKESFIIPVTPQQICTMCHWSSGCDKCCIKCDDQCNSMQICGHNKDFGDQIDRWNTWIKLKDSII